MRKVILFCWRLLDPLYYQFTRLTYIDYRRNIFRVRLTRYLGHPVVLADGTHIQKNDLLLKIHFHNVRLLSELSQIQNEFQKGKVFFHLVKDSLPGIADFLTKHPKQHQIKGLIGITSLNFRSNRLGFEIYPIKNKIYKLIKMSAFLPINILSSVPDSRNKPSHEPVYFFMSRDVLFKRHANFSRKIYVLEENGLIEGDGIT
ncbi:hypothetical protein NST17_10325 [Caldifermentibacillus hisashii]